jgi:starch phosphorylase
LIFSNLKLITPLLREGKLQLIFSGKTHPNDLSGKAIVTKLMEMTKLYPESVVFLQNYDMSIGKILTCGCDVWLNNPIRPMEASGTSGMKAAMNGVLNFSIMDGWWPEGCVPGVTGWQIGDSTVEPDRDQADAGSLYRVLLEEILPTYYQNRTRWAKMMTESVKMSQSRFSAARMIRDYYTLLY